VVTKFPGTAHHDPAAALQKSLDRLDIGYIDIFLVHWPVAQSVEGKNLGISESPTFVETYKLMEPLVGEKCRGIGVSNFTQKTLETLLSETTVVPVVNQVELHALNPNLKLVPWCRKRRIHTMSWRYVTFCLLQYFIFNTYAK
jgi:glycerol 2-dehydrogenase (NADP+)